MPSDHRLKLTNTLTRTKEDFVPEDANNVRMYVCGPTVYDYAHIGNARPVVVFDVLNRLQRHLCGADHVTYVRNITDVDDKINARALRDYPSLALNEAIARVTQKTADQFHADVKALGCMEPDFEPRATQHIAGMIEMINTLISRGHAYQVAGEVLFDTASMPAYGELSRRNLEDQKAGARVAVDAHKKSPGDFVLWKLSSGDEPGWDSPWGRGRPGWHIECSVMSAHHLGPVFDIHGGGLDLIFPHHENEIAQSCCAHGTKLMAHYWLHNGFLQVEGEKMSKSLGNFITLHDLLETEKVGGRKWPGMAIRLVLLMTQYRQPLDFTEKALEEAEGLLEKWDDLLARAGVTATAGAEPATEFLEAMVDDLNTPRALAVLHGLARAARGGDTASAQALADALVFLGFDLADVRRAVDAGRPAAADPALAARVDALIAERNAAREAKDWGEADRIRDLLAAEGVVLKDTKDKATGLVETSWEMAQ